MEFVVPDINLSIIISIVIGGFLFMQGILQLVTGKVFDKSYKKYTAESVKKFARPGGALLAIIGILIALNHFIVFDGVENSWMITTGIAAAFAVILLIFYMVTLKKKN